MSCYYPLQYKHNNVSYFVLNKHLGLNTILSVKSIVFFLKKSLHRVIIFLKECQEYIAAFFLLNSVK